MAVRRALAALEVAENHFNWAEPEYVGAALYEVRAAEEALAAEIRASRPPWEAHTTSASGGETTPSGRRCAPSTSLTEGGKEDAACCRDFETEAKHEDLN